MKSHRGTQFRIWATQRLRTLEAIRAETVALEAESEGLLPEMVAHGDES